MGKLSGEIVQRLRAAKAPAGAIKRVQPLIDKVSDYGPDKGAVIEAVVQYVCGVIEKPPKLSPAFKEDALRRICGGLSKSESLDAWDERVLDVLVGPRAPYWLWDWLRERIEAYPSKPIFERAVEVLRARKIWATDTEVLKTALEHVFGYVTDHAALTSSGRWMLRQLDRDPKGVLAMAQAQKYALARLYPLLAHHRRKLLDALLPELTPKQDKDRSELAEVLLEADARHYEARAITLMECLKDAVAAVTTARALTRFLPGRHGDRVKALLILALKARPQQFWRAVGDLSSTHREAYALAWPALGRGGAGEVWNAYKEENDALRLDFYATIERQAKGFALPWLIDGLVYPKSEIEYGFVTHAKYVSRMLEILKPYDLAPYRERIEKAFAGNKTKKIQEVIATALGKAKAVKKQMTSKKVAPIDGAKGFRFDAYVDGMVKAGFRAAKARIKEIPQPVTSIQLAGIPECIQLNVLVLEGEGEPLEINIKPPNTRIPRDMDETDESPVLRQFARRHGLDADDDETPSWGDAYKLPQCVLIHEQLTGVQALAQMLTKAGVKIAKSCKCGVGDEDSFWGPSDGFDKMARKEIAALPEGQQADFAAVCYESPAKQKWLLNG